ncbi:MAG: holo-ACP synthase [Eubacteriales bacterium]|nr:holo-ACP synthase [Eubacteriales bacterium]
MIVGLGIDLCAIERMEKLLQSDAFLNRYFALEEARYIRGQGAMAAASLAGCFAAKEAFVKALGEGFREIPLSDIVILHTSKGAPRYAVTGIAKEALADRNVRTSHLSITHERDIAAAVCVLES